MEWYSQYILVDDHDRTLYAIIRWIKWLEMGEGAGTMSHQQNGYEMQTVPSSPFCLDLSSNFCSLFSFYVLLFFSFLNIGLFGVLCIITFSLTLVYVLSVFYAFFVNPRDFDLNYPFDFPPML